MPLCRSLWLEDSEYPIGEIDENEAIVEPAQAAQRNPSRVGIRGQDIALSVPNFDSRARYHRNAGAVG